MLLTVTSTNQLGAIAAQLLLHAGNNKIFLFYGDMGAGKTTLIKELCAALGVAEAVTSPTFAIVNEYAGKVDRIYHFDFYRLKQQSEALDMGYEDYFYSGSYCFIEWPEKIPDLLPEHYTRVNVKVLSNSTREINVENI
ncbi:tRNA (adenosine(37)-N6)-threonylcarbamoyltransferase complex ATPase subunit type 1 TsaE [Mucilaginibacter hurinus]|uniref:tRNA threonylcarbamoyladenosine biosynthesis protein TsaE n=1 Tax=Mucilaginibacter hurinus TaxID=2201324 RepID=A0A367GRC8_9SPHI|nr:tRNA (adenosine(37)-N6)-threonylcarbamoyltransferase complex ATPase subunit type 1 TsaE [Mucilaginibacter hurinus]RCH55645.1 tRNA (adenosine(37)-N6)-threonylcarbamoyltransferase complex ATPase subunit type 1 TsaE [Mucilaginibacter hurinus]